MLANWKNLWLFGYMILFTIHKTDILAKQEDEEYLDWSLLGVKHYTNVDYAKKLVEIFKIVDRNYNNFRKTQVPKKMDAFFQEKAIESILLAGRGKLTNDRWNEIGWNKMYKQLDKVIPREMKIEIKYHAMQATRAQNLSELFALFFVKYRAVFYAIQFVDIEGIYQIEKDFKKLRDSCRQVAYQLAVYGVSAAIDLLKAIRRVLDNKYPPAVKEFSEMAQRFENVITSVVENMIFRDDSTEKEKTIFYKTDEFKNDMETLQSYFRVAVLGQTDDPATTYVFLLHGNKEIWSGVKICLSLFKKKRDGLISYDFDDPDYSSKRMYSSIVVEILRLIEVYKMENTLKINKEKELLDLLHGYKSRYLILKPKLDESKGNLYFQVQFTKLTFPK